MMIAIFNVGNNHYIILAPRVQPWVPEPQKLPAAKKRKMTKKESCAGEGERRWEKAFLRLRSSHLLMSISFFLLPFIFTARITLKTYRFSTNYLFYLWQTLFTS